MNIKNKNKNAEQYRQKNNKQTQQQNDNDNDNDIDNDKDKHYGSNSNNNSNNNNSNSSYQQQQRPIGRNSNYSSITYDDAVSIPRINNVPYAHGGFFGAAPFFLADKRWVRILRELLPDVYVEISKRIGGGYYYGYISKYSSYYQADASKLIHWAENNPVVAAYGVVMDLQIRKELELARGRSNNQEEEVATKTEEGHFYHDSASGRSRNRSLNDVVSEIIPAHLIKQSSESIISEYYGTSINSNSNSNTDSINGSSRRRNSSLSTAINTGICEEVNSNHSDPILSSHSQQGTNNSNTAAQAQAHQEQQEIQIEIPNLEWVSYHHTSHQTCI